MNDRGSVFLETIVAAAILAAILGATFDSLRDSADRARRVGLQQQALLVAQSKLAEFPLTRPARSDRTTGTVAGFDWTVDIAPGAGGDEAGLMRVTVRVADTSGEGARVALSSLRQGSSG